MWLAYACGSAFFAGITAILAKVGIKKIDSNLATAIRTIVVLIFAWIMVRLTGSYTPIGSIGTRTLIYLTLSGIATGASWLCYFRALQLGDVNKVTPIDKSSTILTMILAVIFLNEGLNEKKIIAMVLIGVGTMLMITRKKSSGTKSRAWLIYALLSAVFASLTSILAKVGIDGVNSNLGTAYRTGVVLVMAWVVVFVTKKQKQVRSMTFRDGMFLILSGIATGASWLCYYHALQLGPASVVAPVDKLSVLVTVAFSYFVFGEKLNKKEALGLFLLTAGTVAMVFLL